MPFQVEEPKEVPRFGAGVRAQARVAFGNEFADQLFGFTALVGLDGQSGPRQEDSGMAPRDVRVAKRVVRSLESRERTCSVGVIDAGVGQIQRYIPFGQGILFQVGVIEEDRERPDAPIEVGGRPTNLEMKRPPDREHIGIVLGRGHREFFLQNAEPRPRSR